MRKLILCIAIPAFVFSVGNACVFGSSDDSEAVKETIKKKRNAQYAYDHGFAENVMRSSDGGVKLWNRVLVENDGPGSGFSNKGAYLEYIYDKRQVKKILWLENPVCDQASVVFFVCGWKENKDRVNFEISVNGNRITSRKKNDEQYLYVPIKPEWLKKGYNEIVIACPQEKNSHNGYGIVIARKDEYKAGGGDPDAGTKQPASDYYSGLTPILKNSKIATPLSSEPFREIGESSLISTDRGRTWSVKGKGKHPSDRYEKTGVDPQNEPDGVVGEYAIRLNMRQYVREGSLISPVIDLWADSDKPAAIIPFKTTKELTLNFQGDAPKGTSIQWQIRAGTTTDPYSLQNWSDWMTVSNEPVATVKPTSRIMLPPTKWDQGRSMNLPGVRYIQWRAVLKTQDLLKSPVINSVSVERVLIKQTDIPKTLIVTDFYNPQILYSSTGFTYQKAGDPGNKEVIESENLDRVIAGAAGEFDVFVKLLEFSAQRWIYGDPAKYYPKWNAIDIAERAHAYGTGGMCIQQAAHLAHCLTVLGYQARHVNIVTHEVVEVWSNDYKKWVYLDPTEYVALYMFDKKTGVPLNLYDMHIANYKISGITKPIDWMAKPEKDLFRTLDSESVPGIRITTDPAVEKENPDFQGYYTLTEFMRMMPRNDFSTTTIPEPLTQGMMQWPWNGYLNWYDELAPPKLQYSWHTDRKCDFWPTLGFVRYEAVPCVNAEKVFIRMTTFTPSFSHYQVRENNGQWQDSDSTYLWILSPGKNKLQMRTVSKFGVTGAPSFIELNYGRKFFPNEEKK